MRIGMAIGLLASMTVCIGSTSCGTGQSGAVTDTNEKQNPAEAQRTMQKVNTDTDSQRSRSNGALTVLVDGAYSTVAAPFVAVVRDAETYAALRQITGQMPLMNSEFFRSNTIVAAFLGTKRTGGYSVSIEAGADDRLSIRSNSPDSGSMTAQVITAPLKIVSLPIPGAGRLPLDLGGPWKSAMRAYRVTDGQLKISGSGRGRDIESKLAGNVSVMRYGDLVTLEFDLKDPGRQDRVWSDFATGTISPDGAILVRQVNLRGSADSTPQALRFTGKFLDNENRLTLAIAPPDAKSPGQGEASGHIDGVATGPPPPKSTMPVID